MDVAAIEMGRDFRKAIDESVAGCGVLLAMIGPGWLEARNDSGERRLEDADDFVRTEIASALKRDIPLIPVLVRGAKMPHANQLPDDLRDLAYRNCVELTHARWKSDLQVLVGALRSLLADSRDSVSGATDSRSSGAPSDIVRHVAPVDPAISGPLPAMPSSIAAASPTGPRVDDPCGAVVGPEAIADVTRELARYIGPIAEIVVKRAAKRCSTVAELRCAVADEIEFTADRTRFLDACGKA
jgi:hypothetical protein